MAPRRYLALSRNWTVENACGPGVTLTHEIVVPNISHEYNITCANISTPNGTRPYWGNVTNEENVTWVQNFIEERVRESARAHNFFC